MIGRCTMKTPSLLVLLVCSTLVAEPQVGAQEKAEAAPSLYVKKATWPETMTACRARYLVSMGSTRGLL